MKLTDYQILYSVVSTSLSELSAPQSARPSKFAHLASKGATTMMTFDL
ncbi:hypothetical protein KOR42_47820 [Thalassoglobus neptunius]|uniref:Uncharacterized protein n=1 Tax=Thalassoglobus neptunius TaxID=1938619 RepID=A0A5C5VV72_9PLAN|nr:hypothetical protein KOR42_47820 [Thalassoglobus neptunius]